MFYASIKLKSYHSFSFTQKIRAYLNDICIILRHTRKNKNLFDLFSIEILIVSDNFIMEKVESKDKNQFLNCNYE